jgi:hypothetical protein
MLRLLASTLTAAGVAAACTRYAAAQATEARWVGPPTGAWQDPSNWSVAPAYPNNGNPAGVTYNVDLTPASPGTVTIEFPTIIDNLTVGGATLVSSYTGTLRVLGALQINDGGRVQPFKELSNATVTTSGDGRVETLSSQGWLRDVVLNGLAVVDGGELIFQGDTRLGPNGTVRLYAEGADLYVPAAGLRGEGQVVFTGGTGGQSAVRTNSDQLNIGPGVTVRIGDGFGSVIGAALVNEGTLLSEVNGGYLFVNGSSIDNRGTIRARNGGRLELHGNLLNTGTVSVEGATLVLDHIPSAAAAGDLSVRDGRLYLALAAADPSALLRRDNLLHLNVTNSVLAPTGATTMENTGSTLDVRDGTNTWQLLGSTLRGGTLISSDGTPLVVGGTSSLTDVRAEADLSVEPGGRLALRTTTVVAGRTIRLDAGPRPTSPFTGAVLELAGNDALSAGTRVVFDGAAGTASVQRTSLSAAMVVPAGVELVTGTGSGAIRGGSITNNGRVAATAGRTITASAVGGFANAGTLDADGGDIVLPGTRDQTGIIPVTLTNTGTIRLAPGGDVKITGSLVQGTASRLEVAIAGTGVEQFGQLAATGEVRLDGGLFVGAADGAKILPGQSFEVLHFGSRVGDFDALVNQTPYAGLTFTRVYDGDSLTLLAGATAGDATLDGRVDGWDLLRVRSNLGRSGADWLSGDLNGDGRVNARDVALVRRNFGAESPGLAQALSAAAATPVPEPVTPLALLATAWLALSRRRGVSRGI